ncbi:Ankyrin repeat family protein, putative [Theobroma cacao]|nr:Ankyrin repeat family protein, putative [Theobroma cacao]
MRDTATSCMVVDALIIAMVFAAIIAVPGNNEKGIPNFRHETLFEVFVIADAAALFSSSASLLLFVRILTSRYAEEDFIKALPKSLLLGLITLIFSIATMLVASSSALIMLIDAVPGPKVMPRKSTVIPVAILVAFPIIFFIWSQSHLLIDVLLSTYCPTILCY